MELLFFAARALTPIVTLCQQTESWRRADQAKQTIDDFERVPFEKMDGSAFERYSGKLDLREITFNYPVRETPVIEKLSLSLDSGEVLWCNWCEWFRKNDTRKFNCWLARTE